MPVRRKIYKRPNWQRKHPSNHSVSRLTRAVLSEESGEEEYTTEEHRVSHPVMASKTGNQPATVTELKEILKEIKDELCSKMDALAVRLDKRMDQLTLELAKNDRDLKEVKKDVSNLGRKVNQLEEKQSLEFEDHEKRLISMDDQIRRFSLRIRNFKEAAGEDLKKILLQWFKEMFPNLVMEEEDVERVYRVGVFRSRSTPRDILMRFSSFLKKEQLMAKLRSLALLKYQGSTVQIFNDLCPQTLIWRKSVKPITAELRRRVIKYSWGYPVFLRFPYAGKQYRVTSLEQGQELLKNLGLVPDAGAVPKNAADGGGGAGVSGK